LDILQSISLGANYKTKKKQQKAIIMTLKYRQLIEVIVGIEMIAGAQDTLIPDIADALVGVCFDEEEVGQIKAFISDEDHS
jgi:hypothetical protein